MLKIGNTIKWGKIKAPLSLKQTPTDSVVMSVFLQIKCFFDNENQNLTHLYTDAESLDDYVRECFEFPFSPQWNWELFFVHTKKVTLQLVA